MDLTWIQFLCQALDYFIEKYAESEWQIKYKELPPRDPKCTLLLSQSSLFCLWIISSTKIISDSLLFWSDMSTLFRNVTKGRTRRISRNTFHEISQLWIRRSRLQSLHYSTTFNVDSTLWNVLLSCERVWVLLKFDINSLEDDQNMWSVV